MIRPWFMHRRAEVDVRSARETKLLVAVEQLNELTRSLNSVVSEVAEGDLGAGERRR